MGYQMALPGRSPLAPDPVFVSLVGPALDSLRWRGEGGIAGMRGCGCGVGRQRPGLGFESSGNPTTDPLDWSTVDWSFPDFNSFGSSSPSIFGNTAGSSTNLVPLAALAGVVAAVMFMRSGKGGRKRR